MYWLVWKYFGLPEATDVRQERVSIESESRFNPLIWDTNVSGVVNHKGMISRAYFNLLLV